MESDELGLMLNHGGDEVHLLREVLLTAQSLVSVFSRQVGMPPARLSLFRLLAVGPPEGQGVMALSRKLGVNAAAVTRQVQQLAARGLVERRADPGDARRYSVVLTDKGRETFLEFHQRVHRFEEGLSEGIPDVDVEATTRVLARLRAAIEPLL